MKMPHSKPSKGLAFAIAIIVLSLAILTIAALSTVIRKISTAPPQKNQDHNWISYDPTLTRDFDSGIGSGRSQSLFEKPGNRANSPSKDE